MFEFDLLMAVENNFNWDFNFQKGNFYRKAEIL